jgi:ketosteroid isomerase-like protein
VDRGEALRILAALHAAQGTFYAGGPADALREVLADDIEWHVPGSNRIAGDYVGRDAVMAYFARRRDLAAGTFRMQPGEVLSGDGSHVAVLTDGVATVDGRERRWSTVGLYRLGAGRVRACWLLPLDPAAFDAAWGGATA